MPRTVGLASAAVRHDRLHAVADNHDAAVRSWRLWRYRARLHAELLDAQAMSGGSGDAPTAAAAAAAELETARVRAALREASAAAQRQEKELERVSGNSRTEWQSQSHKKKQKEQEKAAEQQQTTHNNKSNKKKKSKQQKHSSEDEADDEEAADRHSRRQRLAEEAHTKQVLSALERTDRNAEAGMRRAVPVPPNHPSYLPPPPITYETVPARTFHDSSKPGSELLHAALAGSGIPGSARAAALKAKKDRDVKEIALSAEAVRALNLPPQPRAAGELERWRTLYCGLHGAPWMRAARGTLREDKVQSEVPTLSYMPTPAGQEVVVKWASAPHDPAVHKRYGKHLQRVKAALDSAEVEQHHKQPRKSRAGHAREKRQPKCV